MVRLLGIGAITMVSLGALEQYIWWLSIAGHLTLVLLMWRHRFHRRYPLFFAYLLFRASRSLLLAGVPIIARMVDKRPNIPFGTNVYFWCWVLTEPLVWFFSIIAILELYSLVLQNYPGIATLSRWVLLVGLLVASMISALTLSTDLRNRTEQFPTLRYVFVFDRGVFSSLVIFMLFITAFLAWYPVPLSRNVVVHCVAYAAYFLSTTAVVLVRNLTGSEVTQTANIMLSCFEISALLVWTIFLNPRGERRTVFIRRQWGGGGGEEERLLEQLAAINSSLLRTARK